MKHPRTALTLSLSLSTISLFTSGCSEVTVVPPGSGTCAASEVLFDGACVDPARRYEPAERADTDNVVAYGDPLTELSLPEPPKRGFRLIAEPRMLGPGEEIELCISWPFPAKLSSDIVHAGRLYTTPGLHHSNVVTKPVDPEDGPQPYPGCHPGAYDPFGELPNVIADVLFANSTQVVGGETLALPEGVGFRIDRSRDIVTSIHFLNTSSEPQKVEVAYDLFMMPEDRLLHEAAPFVVSVNDFLIPPHSKQTIGATCDVFGGSVVSFMPHTHKLLEQFTVDLVHEDGTETPLYAKGAFDTESDIQVYDPPIQVKGSDSIRYGCAFNNTTDKDVTWGLGDNEMCILFGYLYPVPLQFVAFSEFQGEPCQSYQIGLFH
jgi:hypothetical protein